MHFRKYIPLKYFFFFIIIFLLPAFASGQYELSGTVSNATTGAPLQGAVVEIHELNLTTLSGADGRYSFTNLRRALYHIHITHVGFSALTESVRVDGDNQTAHFRLNPTSIELQEILVESNHFKTGAKEHTLAMEILDTDFLRKKGKSTLANALEDIPGINAINTGVGIAKPVIRGMSHNRIIVNNQGIKQEGQQWGSDHGLEIDVFEPGRIEIIKGPASLRYGSDGLGGVINIFSPALPEDSSFTGSFQTMYKTNNGLLGVSAMAQGGKDSKIFRVRLSSQDFGDYRVPAETFTYNSYVLPIYNNRLKNTAGNERNLSVMGGIKKNWGYTTLTASNFHQKSALFVGAVGIPRSYQLTPDGNNRNIDLPYQQTDHLKIVSNTSMLWGKNWAEMDVAYQMNLRRERSNPHAHGKGLRPEGTLAHGMTLQTVSANLRYFQQKENESRVWGMQAEAQQNTRKGFEYLMPQYGRLASGVYVIEEFSWKNRYSFSGGLRADYGLIDILETSEAIYLDERTIGRYYQRNAPVRKSFANLSGSAGLSYYPSQELNMKLNLGTSFRMPGANELAINGIHHGTFRHELGNADLKSERGYQADANVSFQKKFLSVVASGFGAYYRDYIYLAPTAMFSSSLDPDAFPEGGQVYQFLQNNAVYGGGELAIDFHPLHRLHIKSTFECVYNLNLDSRLPLPFTPPPSAFSETSYNFPLRGRVLTDLLLGVSLKKVWAQDRTDRNEKPTGSYHIFGATVSATLEAGRFRADLSLTAQNLGNRFYINHLSRYKLLNLPEQGQNFSFNLLIPFATM